MKSKRVIGSATVLGVVVLLLLALSSCGESGAGGTLSEEDAMAAFGTAFAGYGEVFIDMESGDGTSGSGTTESGCTFSWEITQQEGSSYSFVFTISCTDPSTGLTVSGTITGSYEEPGDGIYAVQIDGNFLVTGAGSATLTFSINVAGSPEDEIVTGTININGTVYDFEELYAGA
jgi:hypothetical protein